MNSPRRAGHAVHSAVSASTPDGSAVAGAQTTYDTTNLLEAALLPPAPMVFERVAGAVSWVAFVKVLIVAGAAGGGVPLVSSGTPLNPAFYIATFVTLGAVGGWLVVGGTWDRGARFLGGFFLLLALACARGACRVMARHLGGDVGAAIVTDLDPLLPVCLWVFAREFPARLRGGSELTRVHRMLSLCAASAAALLAVNFMAATGRHTPATLLVGNSNGYSGITFGLTALAFPYLLLRCVRAPAPSRARASWMLVGLVVGLSPLMLEVVAEVLVPAYASWAHSAAVHPILGSVLFGFLLTLPFTTAYAVVARQTLDVRIVLRRALQCTLTKYACAIACVTPLVYVSWLAYEFRHLTISDIAAQPSAHAAAVAVSLGIVGLFLYPQLLRRVDLLFFGPAYDERRVRSQFRGAIWKSANATASAALLARTATAVLSAERASTVLREAADRTYRDTSTGDVLAADSKLIDLLARDSRGVVPVTELLLASVDDEDVQWVARTTALALVPLRSSSNELLGALSVGPRRDDRPYYAEDWHLLTDLALYASPILERQLSGPSRRMVRTAQMEVPAAECPACGVVIASEDVAECRACAKPLQSSSLPAVVNGKYRLQSRIGRGGMGVVYRAYDEMLGRTVALKTVPFFSHAGEHRSAAEGRLMAGFLHPNLVTVFAFEVALDRPVLVLELLEAGTLKDRLDRGCLPVTDAVDIVMRLCDGLAWLHRQGITHGDIKPSNVGFSRAGVPKLLDFGLAQSTPIHAPSSHGQGLRGTLQYRCPFDATGSSASNDLWALAAVLFECLTGRRLFDVMPSTPSAHDIPDARRFRPEVPPELATVLARALSADPAVRPQTADEFRLWLERTRPV